MSSEFRIKKHLPAHAQITQHLRGEVLSGRWKSGTRLPAIQTMARLFGTNYRTVHLALDPLAREGLIVRVHGSGNYVRERPARLNAVGIYYAVDTWMHPGALFYQLAGGALQNLLAARKIGATILLDSRPESHLGEVLPALAQAARQGEIQGLIVASARPSALPALERLPLPSCFLLSGASVPARIIQDAPQMIAASLGELRRQGCRRIGIVTHLHPGPAEPGDPHRHDSFFEIFRDTAVALGLETREEWEMVPRNFQQVSERLGRDAFRRLWSRRERPDGLFVYPDVVARGVVAAVVETGARVPAEIKMVFHRNAEAEFLTPFPVAWIEASTQAAARSLLEMLEARFRGEEVHPVALPLRLYPPPGTVTSR